MTRRGLLQGLLATGLWSVFSERGNAAQGSSVKDVEKLQKNWQDQLASGVKPPLPSDVLKLTKDEWRKRLNADQFYILREEGTERPGTSPLNNEKRPGIFA